jgi:uncharacterized protein YndB with AHSA1/START domain
MITALQLTVARTFNATRARVWQAFTDPDQFAAWWGPIGNYLPRDQVDFDVRPGGYLRWHEEFPAEPDIATDGSLDLTDVIEGELLAGTMRINGKLPMGYEPFETRIRIEFHDEADGRTRLEVHQWLAEELVSPTHDGWGEAFSKLDNVLHG